MKRTLRRVLYAIGVLSIVLGAFWVLLGAGLLPFAGAREGAWMYRGAMLAFAGAMLAIVSRSMRAREAPPPGDGARPPETSDPNRR